MWHVDVQPRDALNEAVLAELRELGRRSWSASAETTDRYPYAITWAPPTWFALVRDADGRLVGRAGVLLRDVTWGQQQLRVGGVSSVSTAPEVWGRGVASASVSRIMRVLCDELHAEAGLLLASQMGRSVYARLGWREVRATVRCTQPDGELVFTDEFPDVPPMVWSCGDRALADDVTDVNLNGLPW
jgi:GNAT superfamily N-acetyltransferase